MANSVTQYVDPLEPPKFSLLTLNNSRPCGEDVGDGWISYKPPHRNQEYFHNPVLNMVTSIDMQNHSARDAFLKKYRATADKDYETYVGWDDVNQQERVATVNHVGETLEVQDGPNDSGPYFEV